MKCSLDGFERKGHIRPFLHTGGDIASREGFRIAISMLIDIFGDEAEAKCSELGLIRQGAFKTYKAMHDNRINTAVSTSCGRLFDAASAILGIKYEQSFEGEAATALEFKAMEYEGDRNFECMDLIDGDVVATDRIIRYLAEEKLKGSDNRKLAYAFHYMLAKGVARMAMAKSDGIKTVALSGGCYQNKLLTGLTERELKENGFNVLLHSMVPPNDGGIALGQALYGMHKINNQEDI